MPNNAQNHNFTGRKPSKAQGAGDYSGFAWCAKVVDVKATDKTDWQTIAMRFEPSYQLIAAHTTQTKATKRIGFELIK